MEMESRWSDTTDRGPGARKEEEGGVKLVPRDVRGGCFFDIIVECGRNHTIAEV
jgi:hypothetical protein